MPANKAGLESDAMVMKLAGAFGYDIDFARTCAKAANFNVVYDDVYRDGERPATATSSPRPLHQPVKRYGGPLPNAAGETCSSRPDGRCASPSCARSGFTHFLSVLDR